jgi:hypothetical protein
MTVMEDDRNGRWLCVGKHTLDRNSEWEPPCMHRYFRIFLSIYYIIFWGEVFKRLQEEGRGPSDLQKGLCNIWTVPYPPIPSLPKPRTPKNSVYNKIEVSHISLADCSYLVKIVILLIEIAPYLKGMEDHSLLLVTHTSLEYEIRTVENLILFLNMVELSNLARTNW